MKFLRGSAGNALPHRCRQDNFQWIPTLWHFNKTLCHIASAQFGKRSKWRIWSWLAGTFGKTEIWSTHLSSSWKHPAIPYEVLIHPLSMPNHEVVNMETHACNSSGKTDDGEDTKISCVVKQDALIFQMVNWTILGVYLQSEMQSQSWCPPTRRPADEWDPPQLHKHADGTPGTAENMTHLHLGPLNLFFCVQGSARLTSYRPALLQSFWILGFTKQQKSRPPACPYRFMPATQRNWSQLRKMKPYWSLVGNWVNQAPSLL